VGRSREAGCVMAKRRPPQPDPDLGRAHAAELRRQADVAERWSPDRAAWLRRLADGYEAGVLDPVERVWNPDDGRRAFRRRFAG
jgi:hypothetical protein